MRRRIEITLLMWICTCCLLVARPLAGQLDSLLSVTPLMRTSEAGIADLSICSFCPDNFIIQYSIPPAASALNPQRSHRVALLLRSSHHLLPYCLHKITFLEYIEYTSPEIHLIR